MSGLYPVSGSKLFIGGPVESKGKVSETDFTDAEWVEIGGWANAGSLGDTQDVGEQSLINEGRTRKFKTILNGGTMENQFVPISTDSGQAKFKEAIQSRSAYQFKVEWGSGADDGGAPPVGMTDMFYGLALPGARAGGDASAAHLRSWSVAVDSNIVEV